MRFPKEMYRDGIVRVVHSEEEYNAVVAQGWSDYPEVGVTYKPLSAVMPPKPAKPHVIGEGDKNINAEVAKSAAKKELAEEKKEQVKGDADTAAKHLAKAEK